MPHNRRNAGGQLDSDIASPGEAGGRLAQYKERLVARGVRLTRHRLQVLEALASSSGHTTAGKVLAAVQQRYPQTNKTTVYRTMDLLTDLNLVATSHMDGHKYKYELLQAPHHHLICKECGTEIELSDAALTPLRQLIQNEHGFLPCFDHFVLYGVCSACQQ